MSDATPTDGLKRAWDCHVLMREIRGAGIASVIWGVLTLGIGGLAALAEPIMGLVALLGLALLLEGIWLLAAPSPAGLIGEGVTFGVLGLTNMGFAIADVMTSHGKATWLAIGAYQAYLGVQAIRRYVRDKDRLRQPPAKNLQDAVAEIGKDLSKSRAAKRQDIVEVMSTQPVRMRLDAGMAVVFLMPLQMHFVRREEMRLQFTDDSAPKDLTAVVIELPGRGPIKGKMKNEQVERYRAWAGGAALGEPSEKPGAVAAGTEEWVRQARAAGQTDEQIIASLTASGWDEGDARSLIEAADSMDALRGTDA